jgi:hypothetical protein
MPVDGEALLRKHNPVLVIYPQLFEERKNPGAWRPGRQGWGDYHPCSAEFFLGRVTQKDVPDPWSFNPQRLASSFFSSAWRPTVRTGLAALREKAARTPPEATLPWSLDVADIASQDPSLAWKKYEHLVTEQDDAYEPVVYGRFIEAPGHTCLQYWYLYAYNDFRNKHEGDWEMATISIDDEGVPTRVAYSRHNTGFSRAWADVAKADAERQRPLLYVGRGSHAGFFEYYPGGHPAVGLRPHTNTPIGLRPFFSLLQRLPGLRRWRDFPPADPGRDVADSPNHVGVRLDPAVRVMPNEQPGPDSDWWWLRLRCSWGSVHSRFKGTVGPAGPWTIAGMDVRWHDPLGWLSILDRD